MTVVASAILLATTICAAGPRWLRVAQREHYIPSYTTRFWWRWARSGALNGALITTAVVACVGGAFYWPLDLVGALTLLVFPVGLPIRGRTSPLVWTQRLKRLTFSTCVLALIVGVTLTMIATIATAADAIALCLFAFIDASTVVTAPVERRLGSRFVSQARSKLRAIAPRTVAITGSFGKTSTKSHLLDLLSGTYRTVASPGNYNNLLGLSRTINEHVGPGCDVFIAEMGTYGPGEIREMCGLVQPELSVITAISEVHLERMKTLGEVLAAKAEILEPASVVILNVDDPMLVTLADRVEASKRVIRCGSEDTNADVVATTGPNGLCVRTQDWVIQVPAPIAVYAANIACAVAAAAWLGVGKEELEKRLQTLRPPEHRSAIQRADSGLWLIDDTYNSNLEGASAALDRLRDLEVEGRRVVVTPGIVELGHRQFEVNQELGRRAAKSADVVVVVGRTNRQALRQGARDNGSSTVLTVAKRSDATAWVRANLGAGDAVLYENDLPDHYA